MELPMATTASPDFYNELEYDQAKGDWETAGRQGSAPTKTQFLVQREDRTNTIDLCHWYLKHQRGLGWPKVDVSTISEIQKQSFIDGLKPSARPVDHLSESLSGTFLHEVSTAMTKRSAMVC